MVDYMRQLPADGWGLRIAMRERCKVLLLWSAARFKAIAKLRLEIYGSGLAPCVAFTFISNRVRLDVLLSSTYSPKATQQ